MRKLLIDRIEQIKKDNFGFPRTLMRWQQPLMNGTIVKYADEIDFNELNDEDLLFIFERLIRRINLQM